MPSAVGRSATSLPDFESMAIISGGVCVPINSREADSSNAASPGCWMKVLFNHARRYDLFDRNPIELVRQSAKRRKIPEILTVVEIQQLLAALGTRERTLVLLALCTGLRK